MDWKMVCRLDDVDEGRLVEFDVSGVDFLLVRAGNDVIAIPPLCPHMEQSLTAGIVDGETLTCPKHLWQWKIRTGEPIGLAEKPLQLYPVKIEGSGVFVSMNQEITYEYE